MSALDTGVCFAIGLLINLHLPPAQREPTWAIALGTLVFAVFYNLT
jgi:hypothetical protein